MKKSYDYFKTLKDMSAIVSGSFSAVVSGKSPEIYRMNFSGLKTELSTKLTDDFITPIERGDIFILADSLASELVCVKSVSEFSPLFWRDLRKTTGLLSDVFNRQERIFERLSGFKEKGKLISECNDCRGISSNISFYIMRKIKDCICGNEAQPLLRYAVYASFLEVAKDTQKTFSQIERILIEN